MRTCDILVCIPTYNERDTIGDLIDAILALPIKADIVVIDDNSPDGTREQVEARISRTDRVGILARPGRFGVGSAHRLGWMHARQLGYACIVMMDADFSHDPAEIPQLLALLRTGADVAAGSRFMPGAALDYRGWRLFVSRAANRLARWLLRLRLTEHTTSLRAARLDRIPFGLVEAIDHDGYSFFLVCVWRFVRAGLVVRETPIHFRDRRQGVSKLPPIEIVRGALTLLRLATFPGRADQSDVAAPVERVCRSCGGPYLISNGPGALRCLRCCSSGPGA